MKDFSNERCEDAVVFESARKPNEIWKVADEAENMRRFYLFCALVAEKCVSIMLSQ